MFRSKTKNKGVTLVEILVVAGIFALIMVGIGQFSGSVFTYNRNVGNSLSAQQDARQVIRVFARELRTASPSENGSYTIAETGTNAFTFYSDYDRDGLKERIRYYLSGTDLLKEVTEPSGVPAVYSSSPQTTTLVRNLANGGSPIFEYYDSAYTGSESSLAQPVNANAVRLVKINLIIEQDPTQAPTPLVVTTQVSIRNLKDNL